MYRSFYDHVMSLRSRSRTAITGLTIAVLSFSAIGGSPTQAAYSASMTTKRALADHAQEYDRLPLSFIANGGQLDAATRFQVRDQRGVLSFANQAVTLQLPDRSTGTARSPSAGIGLAFEGVNAAVMLSGIDPLPGTANFIIGADPANWHTNVPTFAGVRYHDLYPGVDLQYGGHSGLLKGTYTVAAGVDPAQIRWHYSDTTNLHIDPASADLMIRAAGVTLTEHAPIAWQIGKAGLHPVSVSYRLTPDRSIGFAIAAGAYDRSRPLTIDPGLDYSTYLGGSGNDIGKAIAVDSSGSAYITGLTMGSYNGAKFPTTSGAYQTYDNGSYDTFIVKLNPAGSALAYSTFLGGDSMDQANAIAVDSSGNAVITGYTYSSNFPVTGSAFQRSQNNGSVDGFITKLNATGNGLIYSTYLGGGNFDAINALALDPAGDAYVTGVTTSTDFPVSTGAVQRAFGGGTSDAFVAELNAAGSALIYSTYLGGVGNDAGRGIAIDGGGGAYVTGATSGAFPLTARVLQTAFNGGTDDAFVTKLLPGSTLAYSTYLGGNANDTGIAITVDSSGNATIGGDTASSNFPTTAGSYQPVAGGGTNAFITKLNPSGTGTIYSTYLGGNSDTQIGGLAVDPAGNVIVAGSTSGALPVTSQAVQIALGGGGSDAFVARLTSSGGALTYSTYLGGAGVDFGSGVALDSNQNVYVVGQTGSGFPVSTGAFSTSYGGLSTDAFASKLTLPADVPRIDTIGIFRAGTFYLRLHNTQGAADLTIAFNPPGQNLPIVGDWTGSSFDTIGVYNQANGQFTLCTVNLTSSCTSGANQIAFTLGNPNDTPLAGHWLNGAIHAGAGVYRPSNGILYMKNALSTGFADFSDVLGIAGDDGVAGDWTGQGFDSPGVYRTGNSTFYLSNKVINGVVYGDLSATYGTAGDFPVTGDWTGQGHDGIGLFRQSAGYTYLRNSISTGYPDNAFYYGTAGDVPIAGHWQVIYPPVASVTPTVSPSSPAASGGSVPGGNGIGG